MSRFDTPYHYLCSCKHKTRNYGTDYNQYPDFGLDNGETVGLHLMLKKGSKARIAWGDGKVQVVTGKQKPASEKLAWVEAGHAYPEKGMYYTITICSEEEDAIIGFDGCGMFEVKTLDVILTECLTCVSWAILGMARRNST